MKVKPTNDVTLKEALQAYFNSNPKFKSKLYKSKVKLAWKEKMGAIVNRYTSEVKLRGRTLYIHVDSAPLRHELSMDKPKLLHLMNQELGEEYIDKVVIR